MANATGDGIWLMFLSIWIIQTPQNGQSIAMVNLRIHLQLEHRRSNHFQIPIRWNEWIKFCFSFRCLQTLVVIVFTHYKI